MHGGGPPRLWFSRMDNPNSKKILGAIHPEENRPNLQEALKSIIYDIRITKNSATHFSLFELQFGLNVDRDSILLAALCGMVTYTNLVK